MAWRGWIVALLLLPLLQVAPGAAGGACGALASPTRFFQDDAGSGADAADALPGLALDPDVSDDRIDAYFWAWLDPPVPGNGAADTEDWYVLRLNGATPPFMVNVTSNYTATLAGYTDFALLVLSPEGDAYSTTSTGPTLFLPNLAGAWILRVSTYDASGSCPASLDAPDHGAAALQQNHGIYFGCRPVCVEKG